MSITLPILSGTQSAYNAIENKDPGIIYITRDKGGIYFGDMPLGGTDLGKVVRSVEFDDESATFTVEYTDDSTQTIDLVLESVIQDIEYDSETKDLTFTLVSGATTTISLADLIDVYTGSETDTTETSVSSGEIAVDVKVSEESSNAMEIKSDGLYVAKLTPVSSITDETDESLIPDVAAVKSMLAIAEF